MNNEELRNIVAMVCDNYIDTIMTSIKEDKDKFPLILLVSNFIFELKEKNILLEFNDIFKDLILDRIYKEISSYLAR